MAPTSAPAGLGATLRAGLLSGALAGLVLGLADGLVAWRIGPRLGPLELVGCLGGAVLVDLVVYGAVALAAAVALHPLLRSAAPRARLGWLAGVALGTGIALEGYWWTRPMLFPGLPSTSPERLAVLGGWLVLGLAVGALVGRLVVARLPLGAWRAVAGALALAALAGGATLLQHRSAVAASERGAPNERNRDLPNVLLVVVDALRADVLEPYGSERVRTPNVTRLAERGVVFENAFVQAPYTWTSFGSILTGKYPRRHGLVAMSPELRMKLDRNVTLPWHLKHALLEGSDERLRDGDYAGGTFMTGTLSQGSGLVHGFDCYFEAMSGHDLVVLDSPWSVFRSHLLVAMLKSRLAAKLDSSRVVTTAIDWLRENAGHRFVAMVHLYSTHTPYDPEPRFREMYVDPEYDGPITAFYAEHRMALERGEYEATPADVEQIRNLYYGGVTQADRDLGLLLDELERQGVLDDTLVIFTSDHGEELYDHGLWEHNWMYDTNLRVPLVLAWPRGLPRGARVPAPVETVDLLPTVCDLLGIELPPAEDEYERIDGRSLLPLVRGEVDRVKDHVFAENGRFLSVSDGAWKLIVRDEVLEADGGWERVAAGELERPRLFHVAEDPGETENLFDERRDQAERLYEVLLAYDRSMPIPRVDVRRSARDIDNERLMGDLGYTGGVGDEDVLREAREDGGTR